MVKPRQVKHIVQLAHQLLSPRLVSTRGNKPGRSAKNKEGTSAAVTWWPLKAGDTLRHATLYAAGPLRVKRVIATLHVLAVFTDKDGARRLVTAE